jgi:putative (di)nucleoside polyphosphate hydrolase
MKKYRHAVSALVLKSAGVCTPDGCDVYSVLIVHKPRVRDAWQLPQGGIEEGETVEQAAIRELKEETGLTLDSVEHIEGLEYCYDFPPEFIERWKPVNDGQTLCFVAIKVTADIKVTVDRDEIDSYKWVLPEELPKYLEREAYRDTVMKVLDKYLKR